MVVVIRYVFPYRSRWRDEDRNTRGRPRDFGHMSSMALDLEAGSSLTVTSIDDCPTIATGEGSVATARFATVR
jgi:hypothetical protein